MTDEILYIQIIASAVMVVLTPLSRFIVAKVVGRYVKTNQGVEMRAKIMLKYVNALIILMFVILMIIIWGVSPKNLLITLSSVFGVIGVALFAQWSILSNITSGFIIFFSVPFNIGDKIRILDKDIPMEAVVEDIKAFNIVLKTMENEILIYPNNLILQKGVIVLEPAPPKEDFFPEF